ncbi:urease accessory protein UreD [Singulisphaera acidiphila]|uniref:Urease accessory protein UreH n=1 Tax=Singulisphaera acidiphila (strain ATCC BAA-1392 / DSM 18658 / VKM B-2454 / MOB10) TaxID=886293 RepID=L0D9N1_SINAD|nr:urease accessory protein UreD [Singulisphaera acidiphila]AGA25575.1 urease accessory protein UreH [Singulisphaera acidiphila DSM 18658]
MTRPINDPELAPYQDEPKQLPSGSLGKDARLRLRFERRNERSILAVMERKAPLLVQRAIYCDEGMPALPWVFIITNSGGILQGDRYQIQIEAGPGSFGHVTTQAATKIHEMDANYAAQTQEIVLEPGSYLEYLPDPMIPFRHARFLNQTRIKIDPTATLLYAETLMAGRKYYRDGESFEFDLFSSAVHAERPDGTVLFVEKFVIEPAQVSPRDLGVMGEYDVFGNVILLTPKEHADRILAKIPPTFDRSAHWADGAARLPNDAGLIYKVLAQETGIIRARIRAFWTLVREEVTKHPVPSEFPWR